MMPMLGRFLGYNQINVSSEDQHKTAFTTPKGTFAYSKMSFGLINASVTFKRAMNSSFRHLLNKIIITYLDDVTFLSRRCDLRLVLQRCREHSVSLNP